MSYRDHYDDTLHDLVEREASHDYDPCAVDPEGSTAQGAAEDEMQARPPRPSHEVAEDVRRALDASKDRF